LSQIEVNAPSAADKAGESLLTRNTSRPAPQPHASIPTKKGRPARRRTQPGCSPHNAPNTGNSTRWMARCQINFTSKFCRSDRHWRPMFDSIL